MYAAELTWIWPGAHELESPVKLTGAGYKENKICGKKFNVLYRLCEEQLSAQPHYDFGQG